MKILIDSHGFSGNREILRMIHSFYPEGDVVFEDHITRDTHLDYDWVIQAEIHVFSDTLTCVICLEEKCAEYDCEVRSVAFEKSQLDTNPTVIRKKGKSALLYALHQLLTRKSGHSLPWGILFGVRPAKIVHQRIRSVWSKEKRLHEESGSSVQLLEDLQEGIVGDLQRDLAIDQRRANLLIEVAHHELKAIPDLYDLQNEVSIYVGIPFCPTHCDYCTFPAYSMVDKARYAGGFMEALAQEVKLVGALLKDFHIPVTTVYVGGGTPTSLKAPELNELCALLVEFLPGAGKWREFSIEAGRADTITADRVKVMKDWGVNRVSVNPQSYRGATLKRIGRGHSPEIVDKRFYLFREAGFTNINMDLIMGLPGEGVEDARYSLERTLKLEPDSITVHSLSYKRGSEVTKARESMGMPADEVVADMLNLAEGMIRQKGYFPYYLYRQKDIMANRENIGYALPSKEGIYNISIIEEAQSIIGLGGGADSKWVFPHSGEIVRQANASEPLAYTMHIEHILEKKRVQIEALANSILKSKFSRSLIN